MKKLNILYLEDNKLDLKLVKLCLNTKKIEYNLTHVETKNEFTSAINKNKYDIIFTDYSLPEFSGLEALSLAKKKASDTPVIIISGSIGEELAIETLKEGATDYVLKDNIKRLIPVIERALKEKEENNELKQAENIQKALFNIANAVNTTKSLSEFIETIKIYLGEIVNTENCYIAIYNKHDKTFTLPYQNDEHDHKTVIPANKTFTGYVVKTGKSLLADKNKIEQLVKSGEVEIVGTPSKIWVGVPLKSANKIIGVFVVQSYTNTELYTKKEQKVLEFVSHYIAHAIERKKYEESLQKRNTFIESIINNLPIGLAVNTLNNGAIKYINPKLKEIIELPQKSLINIHDLFNNLQPDKSNKNNFNENTLNNIKSNNTTPLVWHNIPINSSEKIKKVVSIIKIPLEKQNLMITAIQDVTKRILAEEALKKAKEKAEESDKLKSSFLANMSHEIRTPMNSIIGFAELITEPYVSEYQKKVFANQIHSSCDSLLHLINDILDISKIEAGQMDINKIECKVNKLMSDVFISFLNNIEKDKKDIDLKLTTSNDDKNFTILTDLFRLKQIISNLVENAIKFTERGYVEFGYSIKNNNKTIEFFVKDTGIGIPEKKTNFIFERFTKIEDNEDKLYGGTGLGLAISKKLVKLLGGEIWVKSKINEGSIFYFTIPLKTKTPITKEKNNMNDNFIDYNWNGKVILIAEDEESNYNFLIEILSTTNAEVIWAKNGKEAINIFKSNNKINIVLMDIKMPEIDGHEATKQIKKINKNIPVIAQTAFALTEDKERCFLSGCNDFISKPIRPRKLLATIQKYF